MREPGGLIKAEKPKSTEPPHVIKARKTRELRLYEAAEEIAIKTYEVGQDEPKKSPLSHQKRVLAKYIGSAMIQQDRESQEALKETVLVGEVDPLTGLSNRRGLERAIVREIDRIVGENSKLSHQRRTDKNNSFFPQAVLVSLDLNGLKTVNDEKGHSAGDRMLIEEAELISKHTRLSDTVARVGGDEFVVLLFFDVNFEF